MTEEMVKDTGPSPDEIKELRTALGLTFREAAEIIHVTLRGWQAYESGERRMHLAFWELFQMKTKKMPRV